MACPNNPPPEPWQLAPPVYTHIYNNTCRFPTYAELRWAPDQACIWEDLIGWEDGFGRSNILPNVFRRVATKFFLIGWRNWIVNEKAVRKSRVVDALFSLEWVYHFPFSQTVSTAFHFPLLTLLTKALFTVSHCFFLFSPLSIFAFSFSLKPSLSLSRPRDGRRKGFHSSPSSCGGSESRRLWLCRCCWAPQKRRKPFFVFITLSTVIQVRVLLCAFRSCILYFGFCFSVNRVLCLNLSVLLQMLDCVCLLEH